MTDTLAPDARRNLVFSQGVEGPLRGVRKYRNPTTNTLVLEGVPVFRSGTFRDSMGFQHQWETEHMTQMVDNFASLSSRGIVTSVPVRKDHVGFLASSLESVIGYHTAIRTEERVNKVDQTTYTYLLADMEIIDPDAITRIESGLWRNLSSEIGTYLTNAEAEYWPVYMGVAFVDFPAVEGLDSFSKRGPEDSGIHAGSTVFSLVNEQEESDMARNTATTTLSKDGVDPGVSEGGLEDEAINLNETTDNDQEGNDDEDQPQVPDDEGEVEGEGTPTDDESEGDEGEQNAGQAEHGLGGKAFQFSVNGQPTTDFAAVQAHITALEGTLEKLRQDGISDFVNSLATDGKILATQIDSMVNFAKSLDDSQYASWASQYADMSELPLFGKHGAGSNRIADPADMEKSEAIEKELAIQKEILESYSKSTNGRTLPGVEAKITELEQQLAAADGKN